MTNGSWKVILEKCPIADLKTAIIKLEKVTFDEGQKFNYAKIKPKKKIGKVTKSMVSNIKSKGSVRTGSMGSLEPFNSKIVKSEPSIYRKDGQIFKKHVIGNRQFDFLIEPLKKDSKNTSNERNSDLTDTKVNEEKNATKKIYDFSKSMISDEKKNGKVVVKEILTDLIDSVVSGKKIEPIWLKPKKIYDFSKYMISVPDNKKENKAAIKEILEIKNNSITAKEKKSGLVKAKVKKEKLEKLSDNEKNYDVDIEDRAMIVKDEIEELPDYEKIRIKNIQEQKAMFLIELKKSAKALNESMKPKPKASSPNSREREIIQRDYFTRATKRKSDGSFKEICYKEMTPKEIFSDEGFCELSPKPRRFTPKEPNISNIIFDQNYEALGTWRKITRLRPIEYHKKDWDTYVYTPEKKQLRSSVELVIYLSKNPKYWPIFDATVINFEKDNTDYRSDSTRRVINFLNEVNNGVDIETAVSKSLGHLSKKVKNCSDSVKINTIQIPFTCDYCGKTFSHKSNLNRHVSSIHEGRKPVKECNFQDKATKNGFGNVVIKDETGFLQSISW